MWWKGFLVLLYLPATAESLKPSMDAEQGVTNRKPRQVPAAFERLALSEALC